MKTHRFFARPVAYSRNFKHAILMHAAAKRKSHGAKVIFHRDQSAVRQKVPFHAQNGFKILPVFRELVRCGHHRRECLYHAVIRDCNGLMPPARGSRNRLFGVNKPIHRGHLRVKVQFHALVFSLVFPADGFCKVQPVREHAVHAHEIIARIPPVGNKPFPVLPAFFDALHNALFLLAQKKLKRERPRFIGKIKRHDEAFVLPQFHIHRKDFALHGNGSGFFINLLHGHELRARRRAEQHRILRDRCFFCAAARGRSLLCSGLCLHPALWLLLPAPAFRHATRRFRCLLGIRHLQGSIRYKAHLYLQTVKRVHKFRQPGCAVVGFRGFI